jgi:hypothetical protein
VEGEGNGIEEAWFDAYVLTLPPGLPLSLSPTRPPPIAHPRRNCACGMSSLYYKPNHPEIQSQGLENTTEQH